MDTRVEIQQDHQRIRLNLIDFNEAAWRDTVLQAQPVRHSNKRRKISEVRQSPVPGEDNEDDRIWLISRDLEFELDEAIYGRISDGKDVTVEVDADFSLAGESDEATITIYTEGKDRIFSAAVRLAGSARQDAVWASQIRGDAFVKNPLVQGHYEYKCTLHLSPRRLGLGLKVTTTSASIWSDRSLQLSKTEWWELLSHSFPTAKPEPIDARCISVKEFYEAIYVPKNTTEVSQFAQPVGMNAELLPFQRRAVQWMLRREGVDFRPGDRALTLFQEGADLEELPPTFFPETDKRGNTVYVSHIYGIVTRDRQAAFSASKIRGGILAEEMGLGKTVELIALLSLHRRSFTAGEEITYLGRGIRVSGATLVVVPPSILQQWQNEIEKHAPGMKVFVYKGLNQSFPNANNAEIIDEISGYDIVLTTYSVLSSDVHYAKPVTKRTFRGQKVYPVRRSPLVEISWWRICLDEAQMIEGGHSNAAIVAREIPRINAWAITGTPVKKKLDDCFGLLLCLQFKPFCDNKDAWLRLTQYNHAAFKSLFRFLTLRHTKENVRDELVLPPQTRVPVSVPFMHVEEQNYSQLFAQMATECGVDSLGAPIGDDWDPQEHYESMRNWLIRLRQTCLHPEAGAKNKRALGGRNGPLRTVEEVLELMIEQQLGRLRSDERELYSAMIKRGQFHEQVKDPQAALDLWKDALPLVQATIKECRAAYEEEIKTAKAAEKENADLDELGSGDEENSDPKSVKMKNARMRLRGFLELEHTCYYWIGTAYHQLGGLEETKNEADRDATKIADLKLKEEEFYDLAQTSRRELMAETRVKALKLMDVLKKKSETDTFAAVPDFDPTNKGGIESQSILDAIEDLASVLNEQVLLLDEWREKLVQILMEPLFDSDGDSENQGDEHEKAVEKQEESYAYMTAIKALLAQREEVLTGIRNNLLINETRGALQFPGRIHQQLFVDLIQKLDTIHYDSELMSNMRHKVGELRSLVNNLKQQEETGSKPRARLELAIAEPEYKRIHESVTTQTKAVTEIFREVEFCRVSLNARIEFYRQLQSVSDSLLPADPGKRLITATYFEKLIQEEHLVLQRIIRQRSKNRYLEHLRSSKPESQESPNCLICVSPYEIGVLTACGHSFCKECMLLWWKQARTCPDCRSQLRQNDFWQITYRPSSTSTDAPSPTVSGASSPSPPDPQTASTALLQTLSSISLPVSYGTKIDTITRHILHLHSASSGTPKCLLFSQWSDVLDILRISLRRSNISFASLEKRDVLGIDAFRSDPTVTVFLLHAKSQSAGLTLVNATHVFLCEPLVNLSLEAQALGRVHRIGQKRETTVWIYTVQRTVEEGVMRLAERKRGQDMAEEQEEGTSVVQVGEVVKDAELWECLFSGAKEARGEEVRRELLAGAAEGRMLESGV